MRPMYCNLVDLSYIPLLALILLASSIFPSIQAAPTTHDVDENAPVVYYHGTSWTNRTVTGSDGKNKTYRSTSNPGDDVVFCFNGSAIQYYGLPEITNAKFRITLDEIVINSTSLNLGSKRRSSWEGDATLEGRYDNSLFFFQDNLPNTQHTLTITHDDESGKILTIDRLTVTMQDPSDVITTNRGIAGPTSAIPSIGAETPSSAESPLSTTTGSSNKTGTILGAVFGSVIGVALLIALGLWYIRRQSAKARRNRVGISGTGTGTGTGSHSHSQGQYGYEDLKVAMPHFYNQFKSKMGATATATATPKSGIESNTTGSQAPSFPMRSMNDAINISPSPMVPYQIPPPLPPAVLASSGTPNMSPSTTYTKTHGKTMSLDQASNKDLPLTPPPSPPRGANSGSRNFPGTSGGSAAANPFNSSYQNHPYAPFAHDYTRYRSNSLTSFSSHSHAQRDRTGTDQFIRSLSGNGSTASFSYYPDATSADGLARSFTETPMARPDSRQSERSKRFSNQLFSR